MAWQGRRRGAPLGSALHHAVHSRSMNLPELLAEALKLPVAERAHLAETLLESLETLSVEEHRQRWTEEAARRGAELDADPSRGRPAAEVFRAAKARLRA